MPSTRCCGSLFAAVVLASLAGCGATSTDPDLDNRLLEPGSIRAGLHKNAGGVHGDTDFCDGAATCDLGEGDCDRDSQCSPGLVCGNDNGNKYGLQGALEVCVPPHCVNGVQDAGETGVDCGGPCGGICLAACAGPSGGADFCLGCLCSAGQGDCDSNSECGPGLICGADLGAIYGMPANFDVCVASQCSDGVQNFDETGVDCGGVTCGPCPGACVGVPGSAEYCNSCQCGVGEGDCDGDGECATGLVCRRVGPRFGLNNGYDVCIAPSCVNGVQDGLETGVDCGIAAGCGSCTRIAPNGTSHTCSTFFPCPSGWGDCDSDNECQSGLICATRIGKRFGMLGTYDVCVPPQCNDGVQNGNESGIDCGGNPRRPSPCGKCATEVACSNGWDDDGDGSLDCNDSDCFSNPACWICGNGRVDPGEACDDGNHDNTDGCTNACTCGNLFEDVDGDGYGDPTTAQVMCTPSDPFPPAGKARNDVDCNDADAAINPFTPELPNNLIDDDCDGAIDEIDPVEKVLLLASEDPAWLAAVEQAIEALGEFNQVDSYNARYSTPTLSELLAYDAVLAWDNYSYADPTLIGDRLADYFDQGGRVVTAMFVNGRSSQVGRILTDYPVFDRGSWAGGSASLGTILDAGNPLLTGVSTLSAPWAYRALDPHPESFTVVSWSEGTPLVAYRQFGSRIRVDLNFFPVPNSTYGGSWTGDGMELIRNALKL